MYSVNYNNIDELSGIKKGKELEKRAFELAKQVFESTYFAACAASFEPSTLPESVLPLAIVGVENIAFFIQKSMYVNDMLSGRYTEPIELGKVRSLKK